MTDLHTFALLLSDIAPRVLVIGGRFFLDRFDKGHAELEAELKKYESPQDAQQWINMVPIDCLLDTAVDDWNISDSSLDKIAAVFERSWLAIIQAEYGPQPDVSVEIIKDEESGDVFVRLNQTSELRSHIASA